MNWKLLFNWSALRYMFDWTPAAVKVPRPYYKNVKHGQRVLCGYVVEVQYLYHGVRLILFTVERHTSLANKQRVLLDAVHFYRGVKQAVIVARKKQKQKR